MTVSIRTTLHCSLQAFVLAAALLPGVLMAQTSHQITPPTIDKQVTPGDIVTETITITNTLGYVINVFPSVHGFEGGDTNAALGGRFSTEVGEWIELTQAAQVLKPGASTSVDVRIVIPRSVEPGVYRALLGFGQGLNRPEAEKAVYDGRAPDVVVRLVVPEPEVSTNAAVRLRATPIVAWPNQESFTYTVTNPSAKSVSPEGEIIITNGRGAEVASIPLTSQLATLSSGALVREAVTLEELPLFGKYQANLRVNYGPGQLGQLAASDAFYVIPWQVLLALILGLVVLFVLVYFWFKRRLLPAAVVGDPHQIPLHVYEGESPAEDHDINLKA